MATTNSKRTILKKTVVYKSFRLIDFATYDHREEDADFETPSKFIIQMFGINEKGETCSITVSDYKPFFYTKVSDNWTEQNLKLFIAFLEKSSGRKNIKIVGELVQHRKLYGFDGGRKYKFVKLIFDNIQHMNAVKNIWYVQNKDKKGKAGKGERRLIKLQYSTTNNIQEALELYEGAIPPLLRYFHIENISPSGWVKVPLSCKVENDNTTTCTYEFICRCSNIKPINDKETCVPYKICSFDIEASSSHGDFPIPKKTYKRLASNIVNLYYNREHIRLGGVEFMIKKAIITAFGYDTIDDVDIVYPKNQPTQEQINILIDKLLKTSIDIESSIKEAASINTIDKMFEKVKQDFRGAVSDDIETDNIETDETEDIMEISENNYICDEYDCEYDSDEPRNKVHFEQSPTNKKGKNKKIATILENDEITRDKKIDILNYMLTTLIHFPELEGDKVTFIGSTFMLYGSSEPYLNHCAVLGSCDPVEGAIIECVDTEYDLLMNWKRLIEKENPDIIIGYNIFGFDYEFLFRRAEENHCVSEFLEMSRRVGEKSGKIDYNGRIENIEQTSVVLASGEYDLKYFKMTGRLQIDMYTYMRRDFNLPSYKLDDVASQFIGDDIKRIEYCEDDGTTRLYTNNLTGLHVGDYIHIEITTFTTDTYGEKHRIISIVRGDGASSSSTGQTYITIMGNHSDIDQSKSIRWGLAKDDVSPQDIFRLANEGPESRAIVAKYCIQDCNLVHHLMNKIDVITGYNEMSRICSVPISFLVLRGQGIKLTSYVAKKCREKNTLMPDLPRESGADDGYEGAIVLPPKCQMYFDNPVACVDYASLYPSSMISENLSHDSKVWTKEYDLSGKLIRSTGVQNSAGEYIYDNLPGYQYVNIEFDTFQYRKPAPTARAVKTKVGKMICRWAQFPNGQKAIMPSILEELLRARSDTRKYAKTIKDPFMQNILDKRQLGYKVTANSLYGQCGARTSTFYEKDIAASTTATGRKMIIYARNMIEQVYGGGREYNSTGNGIVLTNAEYVYGDSVANYTPIIARFYKKNIIICNIDTLCYEKVKYDFDISRGQGSHKSKNAVHSKFYRDCSNLSWKKCIEPGKEEKEVCILDDVEVWSEQGWTVCTHIIRHKLAPHKKMWRVTTPTGLVDVTDDHSLLRADGSEVSPKCVEIGTELLHHPFTEYPKKCNIYNAPFRIQKCLGKMAAVVASSNTAKFNCQVNAMKYVCECQALGYIVTIESIGTTYIVKIVNQIEDPTKIVSCAGIEYDNYVYDLTTKNHHFAAGVGNLIVHNTDSVFFTFNLKDQTGVDIRGKRALEITIEIAQDVAHLCTSFLKSPMELAYEKTLMPFILLSKKRYVGMLYETNPNKGKLKYMGLSLKRRDSCDYLKDTYGNIIKMLMAGETVTSATNYLNNAMNDLIEAKVPIEKLMLTRSIKSDYKNPAQIAHKVLADRIAKRDPGNKPKSGDRIKFAYIVNSNPRTLLGERIETPEFIRENMLKIDYTYYITNQLMKPLQQLFGLAIEQYYIERGKSEPLRKYCREIDKLRKEYPDLELFMKKKEAYCSKEIKRILFDPILNKIQNLRAGNRDLTTIFSRVPAPKK